MAKDNFYSRKTSLQAMVNAPSASICSAHRPENCLPSDLKPRPYFLPLPSGRQLSLTCLTVWSLICLGVLWMKLSLLLSCYTVFMFIWFLDEPENLEGRKEIFSCLTVFLGSSSELVVLFPVLPLTLVYVLSDFLSVSVMFIFHAPVCLLIWF